MDIEAYRLAAREWITANLAPRSGTRGNMRDPQWARSQRALQRKVFDGGYAGITWPVAYGGQGLSPEHERIFNEEAAGFAVPELGVVGGTTFVVIGPTIMTHAIESFKQRYLPPMLKGDELWVQLFSEPSAGSDLAAVRTRARRDGDDWILSGSKIWTSGADVADFGLCLARSDWDLPKHQGLTWYAVSMKAPGLTVNPIRQIDGKADGFCEEFIEDVRVGSDQIVGEVNGGWLVANTMLGFERGGGITPASPDAGELPPELVRIAREAGRLQDSHIQQVIAQAHVDDFAYRSLQLRVATTFELGGKSAAAFAAYYKLGYGTYPVSRSRAALEIAGPAAMAWTDGSSPEAKLANHYLTETSGSIHGGTNQMQCNAIAERILGLPREASADRDRPFSEVIRGSAEIR